MAEVTRPEHDPIDGDPQRADRSTAVPPGEERVVDDGAATGTARAADGRDPAVERAIADARAERTPSRGDAETARLEPDAPTTRLEPAPTERLEPAETTRLVPARTERLEPAVVAHDDRPTPPTRAQPVIAPADEHAPPPPRRHGNRLVGTAWVLLAAGLFQLLYFGALALIILLLGGQAAVAPGITNIARFPFAWLPVLFFFLLFELTVLLFNRAGRFAYVVASLVVGLLVYVISVLLISIMVGGGIGDTATLARAFESPEFVLTGLVAREVMLWTGFAIGARGTRVRRRDRAARKQYKEEVGDARA